MDLVLQIAAGIGLASCAGLRAFLPLFVVGTAARAGWLRLGEAFAWLDSTPALVILGTAVAAEILADKVPVVDHFLDGVGLFVKPVAGTLVMASTLSETSPQAAMVLGLILGAPAAAGIHLVKAKTRLLSTATTLGLANPAQSVVEDAASFTGCVLCVVAPVAALGLVLLLAVVIWSRTRGRTSA
jgi:hypothetical protein